MEAVGLTTVENTTGMPLVMPPLMPPLRLVRVRSLPSSTPNIASLASLPRRSANPKPVPNCTPLTAGMPNSSAVSSLSTVCSMGSPMPAGSPCTAVSSTAPTESPSRCACSMMAWILRPASASSTGKSGLSSFAMSAARLPSSKCRSQAS